MTLTPVIRSLPRFNLGPVVPYVALLAAMVSLVVGTSTAKSLFPTIGAEGAAALRVGLAAVILLAVFRPWRMKLSRPELTGVLMYGGVLGLLNLTFYMSLKTIPLGVALAIEFAGPLGLALIHSRKAIHFLWVALAVAGLLMLLPLWKGMPALDPVGLGFAAVAAVCWALYIVLGKRVTHMHPGRTVALGMAAAALVVLPFGVAQAGAYLLAPAILAVGLFVAIASSALPYLLEMIAMRAIPKRTFGVLLSVEPAIGALAGLILLHEQLAGLQWLAIGAIVCASVGAVATQNPDREDEGRTPAPPPGA